MNCPTCGAAPAQMPCSHQLRARSAAPVVSVLYVATRLEPSKLVDVTPTLDVLQWLVGGYIEGVTILAGTREQGPVKAWMNEEGALLRMPVTRVVHGPHADSRTLPVRGPFFFMGHTTDGKERSLTEREVAILNSLMTTPAAAVSGVR